MPTIRSLEKLAELVGEHDDRYVRWSRGPGADRQGRSRDDLTGVPLPGLSASALSVEPWWEGRSPVLWVARRLYDYRHLEHQRRGSRPWALVGQECGRGPDNEPLVTCLAPLGWIAAEVVETATRLVTGQRDEWGPLARSGSPAAR